MAHGTNYLLLLFTFILFEEQRLEATPQPLRPVSKQEFDCMGLVDGFYPNPSSCSAYYMCISSNAYHADCVTGLLFHPVTRYCQNATTVQCQQILQSTPATASSTTSTTSKSSLQSTLSSTTLSSTTSQSVLLSSHAANVHTQVTTQQHVSGSTSTPDCSLRTDGEYLEDPADCGAFYICDHGTPVHELCPPGLYYNPAIHVCDFKDHVKNCP